MLDLDSLCDDLRAEHQALDAVVAPLDDASWDVPTPAEPWTVRDQISHLAFFDDQATLAVTDPDGFAGGLIEAAKDVEAFSDGPLELARALAPSEVLTNWRGGRATMLDAFSKLDPTQRVAWYGPTMSPASFISARLMETWAHGQDIVDALGAERSNTVRLRHVAHLGVRARPFSYTVRGLQVPDTDVRVELAGPADELWTWGSPHASDAVAGPAEDFCLVVTQRRHIDDTDLLARGEAAQHWMSIAQCFAGPPGPGRSPGAFPKEIT